jgi:hypothetical protein
VCRDGGFIPFCIMCVYLFTEADAELFCALLVEGLHWNSRSGIVADTCKWSIGAVGSCDRLCCRHVLYDNYWSGLCRLCDLWFGMNLLGCDDLYNWFAGNRLGGWLCRSRGFLGRRSFRHFIR